jgi:tetratricopeptide (TPR) repeat protein
MSWLIPVLFVLNAAPGPPPVPREVERWVAAARAHQPGEVDQALLQIADWTTPNFAILLEHLPKSIAAMTHDEEDRNDVVHRGMVLHTDIALLTPERAASFTWLPGTDSPPRFRRGAKTTVEHEPSVMGRDGEYLQSVWISAHWRLARRLALLSRPDPSRDSFVADWYRAVAALFLVGANLAAGGPHLADARDVIPEDAWILFYSGIVHEMRASPRFQNLKRTYDGPNPPPLRRPRSELASAAEFFRGAVDVNPDFAEAHLRLRHVLGLLGRHDESLAAVQRAMAISTDPRLQYFGNLLAGACLAKLHRPSEARVLFERAAARATTAQAPLIALSQLARSQGDRDGALRAMDRLASLPADPFDRVEPWWDYHLPHAGEADHPIAALRAKFRQETDR